MSIKVYFKKGSLVCETDNPDGYIHHMFLQQSRQKAELSRYFNDSEESSIEADSLIGISQKINEHYSKKYDKYSDVDLVW